MLILNFYKLLLLATSLVYHILTILSILKSGYFILNILGSKKLVKILVRYNFFGYSRLRQMGNIPKIIIGIVRYYNALNTSS